MWLSKALAANGSPKGLRYGNLARCALAVLAAHAHTGDVLVAQTYARDGLVASAQTVPAPAISVTFKEAIDRAIEKNPNVAAAASGILAACRHADPCVRRHHVDEPQSGRRV